HVLRKLVEIDASGSMSSAGVKITDDKQRVTAEVQGSLGSTLMSWLGAHTFTGPAQSARVALVLMGIKFSSQQECTFTFDATLEGDLLAGSLLYRARTNNAPVCGPLTGCTSRQDLRGTRQAK